MGFFDSLGSITSAVGNVINPLMPVFNAASSIFGQNQANQMNAASAQQAQQFSADQFASRYQTTVRDLESAGLSPMLAYSQGGGSPPTGVSYQAQNPYGGAASAYAQTADALNADARRAQLLSSASASNASAALTGEQINLAKANTQKVEAETANLPWEQERIVASTRLLNQQFRTMQEEFYSIGVQRGLMAQQIATLAQNGKVFGEQFNKLVKETQLLGFDVDAAKKFENFGREFGQYKPIVDLILRVFRH